MQGLVIDMASVPTGCSSIQAPSQLLEQGLLIPDEPVHMAESADSQSGKQVVLRLRTGFISSFTTHNTAHTTQHNTTHNTAHTTQRTTLLTQHNTHSTTHTTQHTTLLTQHNTQHCSHRVCAPNAGAHTLNTTHNTAHTTQLTQHNTVRKWHQTNKHIENTKKSTGTLDHTSHKTRIGTLLN